MKSKLVLLFLMCLFSGVIYAQDEVQNKEQERQNREQERQERQRLATERRVNMQSERMKRDFDLTDVQYDSVKKINLKYAQKTDEALKNSRGDFEKRRKILQKNQDEQSRELKTVFTESQYKKYEEQLKVRRERNENREQGAPGQRNPNRREQAPPKNN
jgi:hypothetical protein